MRIFLVTTWDKPCGIAEHSRMLRDHAEDTDITIIPEERWLDPQEFFLNVNAAEDTAGKGVLHLNYHAALHSRWGPEEVKQAQALGYPVVITYHDTYAGTKDQPNSDRAKELCELADAFVVHEPVDDLPRAIYWRQGVLSAEVPMAFDNPTGRPLVGTCGFDFPWKNFDLLAEAAKAAGWGVVYVGGNLTADRVKQLEAKNPWSLFMTGFRDRGEIVAALAGCDATAFLYTCYNTGTSGAIRMGMAARKPMLLMRGCRQFRDIYEADDLRSLCTWMEFSKGDITFTLSTLERGYGMHYIAEHDSWERLGKRYAVLYRGAGMLVDKEDWEKA